MEFVKRLNAALDRGLSKQIFDHLRNYLMCSFLLAIGVVAYRQQEGLLLGYLVVRYSGIGIIGLACLLFSLNLYDGIRQISAARYRPSLVILLIAIYVLIAMRVIELAANFRTGLSAA